MVNRVIQIAKKSWLFLKFFTLNFLCDIRIHCDNVFNYQQYILVKIKATFKIVFLSGKIDILNKLKPFVCNISSYCNLLIQNYYY